MTAMTTALVVDDDPDLCDLVSFKLEQSRYQVRRATSVAEAMQEVAAAKPDVVLLDIMMPGRSGLDALAQWRAEPPTADLPVILLTARAQEYDIDRGFELGADDYIVKPFSPRELVRRVEAVLANRRDGVTPGESSRAPRSP